MSLSKFAVYLTLFSTSAFAQYQLQEDYVSDGNFFSRFNFFTGGDPTHGFVQYVDQGTAQNTGLISASGSNVYIGTDHNNVQPNGRPSVRIQSTATYNSGLFILDLQHMPGGICGTWPAFWTLGPNWPYTGEIDIIEGVHEQTVNDMTEHTTTGCTLANTGAFSGVEQTSNCDINAANQPANAGCGVQSQDTTSYGAGFNNQGGGVYAMEWVSDAISIWYWNHNNVPSDIGSGSPTPANWGKPVSQLYGPDGCNIPNNFQNHQIIFDLTFCGDWAGNVWGSSSCASQASSCNDYVQNNPSAFQGAYWSINSLKVYHIAGQAADSTAFRHIEAKTPLNWTQAQLHQPKAPVPKAVPENSFIPLSPHGKKTKKRSFWSS